jgi:hypothetical protein
MQSYWIYSPKHGLTFLIAQDFLNNNAAMIKKLLLEHILATQTCMCILLLRHYRLKWMITMGSISKHTGSHPEQRSIYNTTTVGILWQSQDRRNELQYMYRKLGLAWDWMCSLPSTGITAIITVITHDEYMAFRETLQKDAWFQYGIRA